VGGLRVGEASLGPGRNAVARSAPRDAIASGRRIDASMDDASTTPSPTAEPAAASAAEPSTPGLRSMVVDLTKVRLNLLVLVTTAVGYVLGRVGVETFDWPRLGLTLLGTGFAAASAAILNQVLEHARDARMHRTRERPLASGRMSRSLAFVAGIVTAYAGFAVLVGAVDATAGGLALANVILYAGVYTPLKPITTINTLVGAICGAIPPMIGWSAATGGLEAGAWIVGGLLFVWQLPHFFALAWLYREDYRRGGHAMLPVLDTDGRLTGQVMTTTAAMLVPVGLLATLFGVSGWWSAAMSVVLGLWFTWRCVAFWRVRTDAAAKSAFLASLSYLPLMLGAMVLDRGPVSAEAWLRGGRDSVTDSAAEPADAAPPVPWPDDDGTPS